MSQFYILNKLPAVLKKIREERKYSLRDVAAKAEISHQTIHYIENGQAIPTIKMLINIAECYGISVDELLKRCQNE